MGINFSPSFNPLHPVYSINRISKFMYTSQSHSSLVPLFFFVLYIYYAFLTHFWIYTKVWNSGGCLISYQVPCTCFFINFIFQTKWNGNSYVDFDISIWTHNIKLIQINYFLTNISRLVAHATRGDLYNQMRHLLFKSWLLYLTNDRCKC